ncbi:hypothetical protein HBB16_05400 [Pseudonocardia sp. MCCB 268]|nr:hypothetical protein [Pseudonocardia cytotoxica]
MEGTSRPGSAPSRCVTDPIHDWLAAARNLDNNFRKAAVKELSPSWRGGHRGTASRSGSRSAPSSASRALAHPRHPAERRVETDTRTWPRARPGASRVLGRRHRRRFAPRPGPGRGGGSAEP